jgi:hypothetical protein
MMSKKHFLVAGLLALCLVLAAAPVLANTYCPPAPVPVVTSGSMDVKIDAVQGATGVAGVVSVTTCENGFKTVKENSCEVSGNGGVAFDKIGKAGDVAVGDFDLKKTNTQTCIAETFHTTTVQHTAQNVASMNQTVVAAATNAGMSGSFEAAGSQTFNQAIVGAVLPGGGVVNSAYAGAQSYKIVGK